MNRLLIFAALAAFALVGGLFYWLITPSDGESSLESEGISTDADGPHQDWLFGPVVLDPPAGDAALRLWSAVTAWLEFPHLYELQRPKTVADGHYIAETFRPYLEARDWVSIDRGEQIDFGSYDPKSG